jgi:hypothetical protein
MFYPTLTLNPTGRRTEDRADFETVWRRQFDATRGAAAKRGVTRAPFQNIEPRDVRVDFPASTVAVVTFHLDLSGNVPGRRMFVVAKTAGAWKITHLHASNMSPAALL